MLALAGDLAIMLDRYDEGFALIEESLACSAAAGEAPAPMAVLALGLAALVQNRSEDAVRFGEEVIAVAAIHQQREVGDSSAPRATSPSKRTFATASKAGSILNASPRSGQKAGP